MRNRFGSVDEIVEIEDQDVRHCNWVRFVRSSTNVDDVNIVATKVRGEPLFQIVKEVPPNGELLVYFDDDASDRLAARVSSQSGVPKPILSERPRVCENLPKPSKPTAMTTKKLLVVERLSVGEIYNRHSISTETSPTQRAEECSSIGSDISPERHLTPNHKKSPLVGVLKFHLPRLVPSSGVASIVIDGSSPSSSVIRLLSFQSHNLQHILYIHLVTGLPLFLFRGRFNYLHACMFETSRRLTCTHHFHIFDTPAVPCMLDQLVFDIVFPCHSAHPSQHPHFTNPTYMSTRYDIIIASNWSQ